MIPNEHVYIKFTSLMELGQPQAVPRTLPSTSAEKVKFEAISYGFAPPRITPDEQVAFLTFSRVCQPPVSS